MLDDTADKIKGLAVGGVDYITKPFQEEEVLARVETQLALLWTQKRLQEQVAELDAFARTVAHDLKNPLGVITSYASFLVENWSNLGGDELTKLLGDIERVGYKAVKIVDSLLLLASLQKSELEAQSLNMADIIGEIQNRLVSMIAAYHGDIILPTEWPVSLGNALWVEEVWMNYLSNGLKYGGRPPRLELGAAAHPEGMIRFWVRDNGPGLLWRNKPSYLPNFLVSARLRSGKVTVWVCRLFGASSRN